MYEADQSHTSLDRSDREKVERDRAERMKIFRKNFATLLEVTKEEGFPDISFETRQADSCRYWAVTATLIHIMQTAPELIFDEEVIDLFEDEIRKGNLTPDDLTPAFRVTTGGSTLFCEELKPAIEKAVVVWKIDEKSKERIGYKECPR